MYKSQAARDAQAYGDPDYWDYLDQHAQKLHDKFLKKGNRVAADLMFTRSLCGVLQGNEGE